MRIWNGGPILLAPLLGAGACSTVGADVSAGGMLAAAQEVPPVLWALCLPLTAGCLFLRFLRWQYLLRSADVRVPIRRSLRIYLASLVGVATPAYAGEALRLAFFRREFGLPFRRTLPVLVADRLYDVAALAILSGAAFRHLGGAVVLAGAGAALSYRLVSSSIAKPDLAGLLRPATALTSLGTSLLAWAPLGMAFSVATPAGLSWRGSEAFAGSLLGTGVSPLPAGIAATLIAEPAAASMASVLLLVGSVTLAVGAVFLFTEIRRIRGWRGAGDLHFDDIADEYLAQWSSHMWKLLLDRRVSLITKALGRSPSEIGPGLDLGCGLGHQARALAEQGYPVVGIDPAYNLLRYARGSGVLVTTGSALELPFREESLDFVYTVGVLHHLPDPKAQDLACREIARVLRPGGVLIVQETNPRNPLFLLYMSYLFPLMKSIDEGTEWWIDPRRWSRAEGLELVDVHYFTFLPDFLPAPLLPYSLAMESWLAGTRARPYSVHYMSVLRKPEKRSTATFPEGGQIRSAVPGAAC